VELVDGDDDDDALLVRPPYHGDAAELPVAVDGVDQDCRAPRTVSRSARWRRASRRRTTPSTGWRPYVFTRDLERAMRVCGSLEAGMVGLNLGVISNPAAPFGGMKASGFGREGGAEGIDEYLETQYVAIAAS
jgi:Aldehyde dehydrogenase family